VTRLPNGECCDRDDRRNGRCCPPDEIRLPNGQCCSPREIRDGRCRPLPPPPCPRDEIRLPNGQCCPRTDVRDGQCKPIIRRLLDVTPPTRKPIVIDVPPRGKPVVDHKPPRREVFRWPVRTKSPIVRETSGSGGGRSFGLMSHGGGMSFMHGGRGR
jgi:hypothetical protein